MISSVPSLLFNLVFFSHLPVVERTPGCLFVPRALFFFLRVFFVKAEVLNNTGKIPNYFNLNDLKLVILVTRCQAVDSLDQNRQILTLHVSYVTRFGPVFLKVYQYK